MGGTVAPHFHIDLYLSFRPSSPRWLHTHYMKHQKAFWCLGLSVSCFPRGTQPPWAWVIIHIPLYKHHRCPSLTLYLSPLLLLLSSFHHPLLSSLSNPLLSCSDWAISSPPCSCSPFSLQHPWLLSSRAALFPSPLCCFFSSPPLHPPTPFPSSAVLSPVFRLKTGSGKMASSQIALAHPLKHDHTHAHNNTDLINQ